MDPFLYLQLFHRRRHWFEGSDDETDVLSRNVIPTDFTDSMTLRATAVVTLPGISRHVTF